MGLGVRERLFRVLEEVGLNREIISLRMNNII
jgi:hypothetical protein